jgi:hypothetical protein
MHKNIHLVLMAGVAALTVNLSGSASATPAALSLQQGQASVAGVERVGHRRWYGRHAYGYRPYYRPYAYYRPYYRPYAYYGAPYGYYGRPYGYYGGPGLGWWGPRFSIGLGF